MSIPPGTHVHGIRLIRFLGDKLRTHVTPCEDDPPEMLEVKVAGCYSERLGPWCWLHFFSLSLGLGQRPNGFHGGEPRPQLWWQNQYDLCRIHLSLAHSHDENSSVRLRGKCVLMFPLPLDIIISSAVPRNIQLRSRVCHCCYREKLIEGWTAWTLWVCVWTVQVNIYTV